ncbi:MAG: hypothetical protein HQ494_11530 [Rhodospirillales bacterium]|nr:hypothetical protein [Rhodospirillales bacterium]
MAQEVNYEVLVEQNGRWSIHARYEGHEKEPAVNEGRQLEKLPSVTAVKVIKEVYDTEREVHSEYVVFKSSGMKMAPSNKGANGGNSDATKSGGGNTWLEGNSKNSKNRGSPRPKPGKVGRAKKSSTMTTIIVKLLMVILFSIIIAGGAAMMIDSLLGGTRLFGFHFVGNAESNLLIGVFTVTFLICATALARTLMRGENLEASRIRRTKESQARQEGARQKVRKKAAQSKAAKNPQDDLKAKAKEQTKKNQDKLDEAMKGAENFEVERAAGSKSETPEAQAALNEATTDRLQAELNKDKPKPEDENTKRGVVLDAATTPAQATPQADKMTPQEEKQKAYMLKFLSQALEGGEADQAKMDNFNKFGVNLFLAGACEIVSQKENLSALARSKILANTVQVMGFKKSHAASFADKYEEYLMADSRYMQMFQAGRNAVNIYSTEESSGPRLLDNALAEWNKPKQKEEDTGPVTVLFTDIAGSTAMTQTMGDAGAQQVVRVHNRVVREALSAFAGREVKHTGDGIMASFAKTSDSVDAAIQMQRETMKHNQAEPDLPLHLKIGMNAGEPIAEDNDLFGTVVQLSARIVDKASADEIYVSEIVRGICAGKNFKFKNLGGFPMKGFGDDITLFEVIWNEDQPE